MFCKSVVQKRQLEMSLCKLLAFVQVGLTYPGEPALYIQSVTFASQATEMPYCIPRLTATACAL